MRPREHPVPLDRALEDYARSQGAYVGSVECLAWHHLHFIYGRGRDFFSLDVRIPPDRTLYADKEAVLDALYDEAVRRLDDRLSKIRRLPTVGEVPDLTS